MIADSQTGDGCGDVDHSLHAAEDAQGCIAKGVGPTITRWIPVEEGAWRLGKTARALREMCRRAPTRDEGYRMVADLGGGVLAVKLGRQWRIWIPPMETEKPKQNGE